VKGSQKSRSTADRVAVQLTTWPGLKAGRPYCGAGHGFSFHGEQILHLHTGDEADLRLTRPFVQRLDTVLAESGQVVIRPGDDWVTVHLESDTAGSLLISLTSLAIHAQTERPTVQPCSWAARSRASVRGLLRPRWA
jgi:luciferase-like monooxygenase